MTNLLIFLFASAGLTWITNKSAILKPFREWLTSKSVMLGKLFSCGYCMGFWAGAIMFYFIFSGYIMLLPLSFAASFFTGVSFTILNYIDRK